MSKPPALTVADFQHGMANLLPRGDAWPRDSDTILMRLLKALAPTWLRNYQAAVGLLADAFPGTSTALIDEWMSSVGLPDECFLASPTLAQKRAAVVSKLAAHPNSTPSYVNIVLAAFGYNTALVSYLEFRPFEVELSTVETPLFGPEWGASVIITVPTLGSAIDTAAQCTLQKMLRAGADFFFNFV